jgi:hypothetical protein
LDNFATRAREKTVDFRLNEHSHPAGPIRIGLALSGGGYRAAVFHAGVIYELQRRGIPIRAVSSVSGGSIVAAAVMHGMPPQEFVSLVKSGRFNLARTIIDPQFVLPWVIDHLVPWAPGRIESEKLHQLDAHHSRTGAQADLLKAAIGLGNDTEFPLDHEVEWFINATDLAGKQLVGLHHAGILLLPIANAQSFSRSASLTVAPRWGGPYGEAQILGPWSKYSSIGLEQIVAASGAFPGAFEPLRLNASGQSFHLADGGLIDNSGVVMLQVAADLAQRHPKDLALARCQVDVVVASDGSALSEDQLGKGASSTHDRTIEGIGAAVNAIYSFSGAPYSSAMTTEPRVLSISPRLLYGGTSSEDALVSDELMRRVRLLKANDLADIDKILGIVLIPGTRDSRSELAWKHRKERSSYGNGDPHVESMSVLLSTFRDAKTLDARLTNDACDELFSLGRALVILNGAELDQLAPSS